MNGRLFQQSLVNTVGVVERFFVVIFFSYIAAIIVSFDMCIGIERLVPYYSRAVTLPPIPIRVGMY
eukprot:m.65797 g.65797  ORF g.65797 m.65797 type:complete len:66 (+) comp11539_c2_seq2:66-263(+)